MENFVAPLVGAWVEILYRFLLHILPLSLPSWERGLKLVLGKCMNRVSAVAPLVGAWVEITQIKKRTGF